jgi:SAM-dependent methyltransferase
MSTGKNLEAWSLPNCVNFYGQGRCRVGDLYPSEASMLLPVMPSTTSVLDVGCAAGNCYSVFKELNPHASYTGIDTAEAMIQEARRRHPGVAFHVGDGRTLPFEDGAFDLVFCTGVLNHNPDYLDMIAETLRVAKRCAVIDLPRLVTHPYVFDLAHSYMELKARFTDGAERIEREATRVPYVLANANELFRTLLIRFGGVLSGLACHGYYGTPHASVTLPYSPVIFAVLLLVKGKGLVRYRLQLPDDVLQSATDALGSLGAIEGASIDSLITRA